MILEGFGAHFILPFRTELLWFLILEQGHGLLLPTWMAFAASLAGWMVSFGLGYYVAGSRIDDAGREKGYRRAQHLAGRYAIWLMLVPGLPLSGALVLVLGLLRVSWRNVLAMAVAGRCLHYGYYLLEYSMKHG